jgi:hypothetical protein
MGKLKYLVIHCTATKQGQTVTSNDIRKWHLENRGWKQVGYSDMIHQNGIIENLVPYNTDSSVDPWEITNGVEGHNSECRHIVYVGGLTTDGKTAADTRTGQQLKALQSYVKRTIEFHPEILVVGHNQFAAKACPGFDVPQWLKNIGIEPKNIKDGKL